MALATFSTKNAMFVKKLFLVEKKKKKKRGEKKRALKRALRIRY